MKINYLGLVKKCGKSLQLSKGKATVNWFLYDDFTVIRVYGFWGFRYVFSAFLTSQIFFMEFARQRIATEDLYFTKVKRASNLKFPFTLGSVTFRNRACLTILESYLCQFQFQLALSIRYDPSDVISIRKEIKSVEAKEHVGLEGLQEIANREEPPEVKSFVGLISQDVMNGVEPELEVMRVSIVVSELRKISVSDAMAMEVDQPSSSK